MQWYYLDSNRKQVEVSDEQLAELYKNGTINKDTLVWNEDMTDWTPLGTARPDIVTNAPVAGAVSTPEPSASAAAAPVVSTSKPTGGSGTGLNPYAAPSSTLTPDNSTVRAIAGVLASNAAWIKFLAILNIISGAISCITIIGAIVGWLPIWLGVILLKAANSAREAESTGSQTELTEALQKVGLYFKINGILIVIMLAFYAIVFILSIAAGGFASYSTGSGM